MRRQIFIVLIAVFLLRLPFLNTPAQWDDFNYLGAGNYALTHPAHPSHHQYVFQGEWFSMRGHPHPPGMAWILALVMILLGPFREIPFHVAFLVFSFVAALSMLALARRFIPERAVHATLLFLAVPASMVSGTSFESDLPLLAFWTLAMALFIEAVERRCGRLLALAALSMAGAAMVAFTAFLIAPVCAIYLWTRRCAWRAAWLALATPFAVIGGYQLFERITTGQFPFEVLTGHFKTYRLQRFELKLKNALSLTAQLGLTLSPLVWLALGRRVKSWTWIVAVTAAALIAIVSGHYTVLLWAPAAFGVAALLYATNQLRDENDRFFAAWVLLYFAAALVIFFAGAARYLLPLAAPLSILAARALRDRTGWLNAAIAANIALGLSFAFVNLAQWRQSKQFAYDSMALAQGRQVWVSAEWGLRHYAEALGAKPLVRDATLNGGDMLITSTLSPFVPYFSDSAKIERRLVHDIIPALPIRIAGAGIDTGYATVGFGLAAFAISNKPVDHLELLEVVSIEPTLSWLPMNAPESEWQIASGAYTLEANAWRWAQRESVYRLKPPTTPSRLRADITIPGDAPGRTVQLALNGTIVATATYTTPGNYTLISDAVTLDSSKATVTLTIDKDFQPPGESRKLALIVGAIGFVPQAQGGRDNK